MFNHLGIISECAYCSHDNNWRSTEQFLSVNLQYSSSLRELSPPSAVLIRPFWGPAEGWGRKSLRDGLGVLELGGGESLEHFWKVGRSTLFAYLNLQQGEKGMARSREWQSVTSGVQRSVCLEQLLYLGKGSGSSCIRHSNLECRLPPSLDPLRVSSLLPPSVNCLLQNKLRCNIDGWNVLLSHLCKTTISTSSLPIYTINDIASCR